MNISFTPQAEADLLSIHSYISDYSEAKAIEYVARVLQSIRVLDRFPLLGRVGRVEGTREWSLPGLPYIAIYRVKSETELEVLTIKHERQQYP